MLSNVRKACCVAGGINLVPKEEDVLEVGGRVQGVSRGVDQAWQHHKSPKTDICNSACVFTHSFGCVKTVETTLEMNNWTSQVSVKSGA